MEYVEKKGNNIKTRCKKYYARQAKLPCDVCDSDAAAPNVLFDNQLHSSDKIKFQNKVKENPLFPTEPSSMVFYNCYCVVNIPVICLVLHTCNLG